MDLNKKREELLKCTRDVLDDLREMIGRTGFHEAEKSALADSIRQLDHLFMIVVAGEFNSGKSAFINALLGEKLQEEGVTPTTSQIHVLQYGETVQSQPGPQGAWLQSAPIEMLRNTNIVDTPGTNAILREHELLTTNFIPRSDLVLFITSADRPFTESERAFLELIKSWGKKIVLVINKVDILADSEVEKVVEFVKSAADKLVGDMPAVFAVSAKKAQQVKTEDKNQPGLTGFETLEGFIHQTLDDVGRFRLKLLNPLGVGQKLVRQQLEVCREDIDSLIEDVTVLDDIQGQMALYNEDMQRDFKARLSEIGNLLLEMEKRGHTFFNETIRFGRIIDLIRRDKMRMEFERNVVAETPQKIESRVSELIDWLVEQELRQWTSVADHLQRRQQQHEARIVGQTGSKEGTLSYDRQRLIDSIGLATRQAVATYNKEAEAAQMAGSAREAVINSGLVSLGGAGLGAAVAVFVHTVWADMTGILTGVAGLIFGLYILPSRRQKGKRRLTEKLSELHRKLSEGLTEQFDRELRRSIRRVEDIVAPYSRFVRSEQNKIMTRRDKFDELGSRILGLQNQLKEIN